MSQGLKISELEKRLKITRRQVNYSIHKLNDWLSENNLPIIENKRQTGLAVDPAVIREFPSLMDMEATNEYVPSENERISLILLMLLGRKEEMSLYHFSSALKVSRNTILSDLKKMEEMLSKRDLILFYTRRDGYVIQGGEMEKRKLLGELVNKLIESSEGEKWLLSVMELQESELEHLRQRFEAIEKKLNTRFTDEKLHSLPIILSLLYRRIHRGRHPEAYEIRFVDLSNTKEFQLVEDLFWNMEEINEQDRLYITLQLLSSSVASPNVDEEGLEDAAVQAIQQFVGNFEKIACVTFQERNQLLQKLYQHMKPAFYRIIFGLSVENPLLKEIQTEYGEIHHLVKRSILPLEHFVGKEILEDEVAYLTILLKSSLQQQGDDILERPKAVVVCPNGISVSKLLFENLKEMFPEIIFLDHISVRDFMNYQLDFDLVFSTVFLRTEKKVFVIKPLFTDMEKRNLKLQVFQELKGVSPTTIDYEGLVDLIQMHGDIPNPDSLKQALKTFFNKGQAFRAEIQEEIKLTLVDIIPKEFIQLQQTASSWEEAIRLAAQPLIEAKTVKPEYADAIIRMIHRNGPYMLIAPNVAIPHASPEDGVNRLSMSVMTLKEAIPFSEELSIQVIIVIAAVDRRMHLKALTQLNNLVSDETNVTAIIEAAEVDEISSLFQQFSIT